MFRCIQIIGKLYATRSKKCVLKRDRQQVRPVVLAMFIECLKNKCYNISHRRLRVTKMLLPVELSWTSGPGGRIYRSAGRACTGEPEH